MFKSPTDTIIRLPFTLNIEKIVEQANDFFEREILARSQKDKIGIIYSCNLIQAKQFYSSYATCEVNDIIKGEVAGLNLFFQLVINKIQASNLQRKVHILPIPTSIHGGCNLPSITSNNFVELCDLDEALVNIARHIGTGFKIIGLTDKDNHFLIGAKRTRDNLNTENTASWFEAEKIRLISIKRDSANHHVYQQQVNHEGFKDNRLDILSQGQYIMIRLDKMQQQSSNLWPDYLREAYMEGIQNPDFFVKTQYVSLKETDPILGSNSSADNTYGCCNSCRLV